MTLSLDVVQALAPNQFPNLLATALRCEDVLDWAAAQDIKAVRSSG
ncbi:hypothetical protein ATSB10_02880 [Dyella thiooxydans]|uniref:Uncharacterized protein n=1 Tax=Dyella thiooxydans TaxID=445710 RepID=A0A160MYM5_9GAMM|nr:hypothetical protein [Dyella thiooxydans]AND67742.1 hypothetical protein ATSB10_02880 [Dyella thiooxydans]